MSTIEVKVPDIGDFKDVPVIEVFIKPGDVVKAEDSLVTLESDKATMDVPAPAAGTVKDLKVKVGDKVSEGSVLLLLETGGAASRAGTEAPAADAPAQPATAPSHPVPRAAPLPPAPQARLPSAPRTTHAAAARLQSCRGSAPSPASGRSVQAASACPMARQ